MSAAISGRLFRDCTSHLRTTPVAARCRHFILSVFYVGILFLRFAVIANIVEMRFIELRPTPIASGFYCDAAAVGGKEYEKGNSGETRLQDSLQIACIFVVSSSVSSTALSPNSSSTAGAVIRCSFRSTGGRNCGRPSAFRHWNSNCGNPAAAEP